MAIYHFSGKIITRAKNQSAVASASYRSGEKLVDERTGEVKFYKRDVQPETMILAPSHAPEWVHDRQRLWNEVEAVEKNWNSQLAREFNIALPKELSNEQQLELIRDFAQKEFVDKGMVADIAIHRDDKDNPHAHVMLTMRKFEENGKWGNKKRKEYLYGENGEKLLDKKGKPKYITHSLTDWDRTETLEKWREEWANHTNRALEQANVQERISHLSHEARGLEEVPTVHLGHVAHAMEKEGKQSERGDINRKIEASNKEISNINAEIKKLNETIIKIQESEAKSKFTPDEKAILQNAKTILKDKKINYPNICSRLEQLERFQDRIHKNEKEIYDKGFILDDKDREKISQYQRQRKLINTEKAILTKAKTILEESMIRQVASQYPDTPEIKYMKFDQALKLYKLNSDLNRIVPINEIKHAHEDLEKKLEKYEKSLKNNESPKIDNSKLEKMKNANDLFGGIFEAIQQANKDMERKSKLEERQRYRRGHKKKELELERE